MTVFSCSHNACAQESRTKAELVSHLLPLITPNDQLAIFSPSRQLWFCWFNSLSTQAQNDFTKASIMPPLIWKLKLQPSNSELLMTLNKNKGGYKIGWGNESRPSRARRIAATE